MEYRNAIAKCLAGDKAAYAAVVAAFADPLAALLRRLLGNEEDVRDVAQEAFMRAYVNLHRYDPARPFEPWLYRIARNLAYNHLQSRRRRRERPLHQEEARRDMEPEARGAAPEAPLLERERKDRVRKLLLELRPEYREVLTLRYLARLEYEAVSERMGVPVGTVKTWLNRAKKALRHRAEKGEAH